MVKRLLALLLLAAIGGIFTTLVLGYMPDAELNNTARYYADHTAADIGSANLVTASSSPIVAWIPWVRSRCCSWLPPYSGWFWRAAGARCRPGGN